MLDQPGDLHALGDERRHDLTQAVVPRVSGVLGEDRIGLDIRAGLIPHRCFLSLEVRKVNNEYAIRVHIRERPEHRVALSDEQPASGLEQSRDRFGPA